MVRTLILVFGLAVTLCPIARAQTPSPDAKDATVQKAHIEMHEKMAQAHREAADCLKSGRPMGVCRDQLMKATEGMRGMGMGMGPRMRAGDCNCEDCKDCKNCPHCKGKPCAHCNKKGRGPSKPSAAE